MYRIEYYDADNDCWLYAEPKFKSIKAWYDDVDEIFEAIERLEKAHPGYKFRLLKG